MTFRPLILAATLGLGAGIAQAADVAPGALLGTDMVQIRDALAADSYSLTEYEQEDGKIEVTATRDGKRWEFKIDPATGKVTGIEQDS